MAPGEAVEDKLHDLVELAGEAVEIAFKKDRRTGETEEYVLQQPGGAGRVLEAAVAGLGAAIEDILNDHRLGRLPFAGEGNPLFQDLLREFIGFRPVVIAVIGELQLGAEIGAEAVG